MATHRNARHGVRAMRTSDTNSARKLSPIKSQPETAIAEAPAVAAPASSPAATD
ncbi:hypothetical protein [Streptomyces sp. NBC_01477]|uniref:hypothetical protein n=1 Tax=Streptomyces sp. NBC_01477 TaxID=2976015 RepID=UPI002E318732|nr:hypothetical protein [Streptomyces sp. NBC_01477]